MKALYIAILVLGLAMPASGQDAVKWVFTDYPPANYQSEDGHFKGFFHDIVLEVFNQGLGLRVDIAVFPWKRCQKMVETGEADIMVTVPTTLRLEYSLTHTRPIWIKRRILYTYGGHPRMNEIEQLNGLAAVRNGGYKVISYLGNDWTKREVQNSGIPVIYATSVDGMYRMLAAHRGDLVIEEKSLADPRIADLGLSKRIVETKGVGSKSGFHILVSKKSAFADRISQIDREVEAMRSRHRFEQIFSNYGLTAGQ
jgi:polar amino acid transport system substrate-binding protein